MKPVCLVVGAGAGIGGHVAKRFACSHHVEFVRRRDSAGLRALEKAIEESGGTARGTLLDVTEQDSLESYVKQIQKEGDVEVVVYNLGAQMGEKSLEETSEKSFELAWRLGVLGLFRLVKSVVPQMKERGRGTILVTSSTASVRGNEGQHAHSAAMGARRLSCQSLSAELANKGIHVVHVVVDGAVEAPDTLGRLLGADRFRLLKEKGLLMNPAAIADTYFHLYQQPSSVWTHELDLRNSKDVAWWNSRPMSKL